MHIRKCEAWLWQCPFCLFEGVGINEYVAKWTLEYHVTYACGIVQAKKKQATEQVFA